MKTPIEYTVEIFRNGLLNRKLHLHDNVPTSVRKFYSARLRQLHLHFPLLKRNIRKLNCEFRIIVGFQDKCSPLRHYRRCLQWILNLSLNSMQASLNSWLASRSRTKESQRLGLWRGSCVRVELEIVSLIDSWTDRVQGWHK